MFVRNIENKVFEARFELNSGKYLKLFTMKELIVFITICMLWFDSSNGRPNDEDSIQRTPSQIVMDSVSLTGTC